MISYVCRGVFGSYISLFENPLLSPGLSLMPVYPGLGDRHIQSGLGEAAVPRSDLRSVAWLWSPSSCRQVISSWQVLCHCGCCCRLPSEYTFTSTTTSNFRCSLWWHKFYWRLAPSPPSLDDSQAAGPLGRSKRRRYFHSAWNFSSNYLIKFLVFHARAKTLIFMPCEVSFVQKPGRFECPRESRSFRYYKLTLFLVRTVYVVITFYFPEEIIKLGFQWCSWCWKHKGGVEPRWCLCCKHIDDVYLSNCKE